MSHRHRRQIRRRVRALSYIRWLARTCVLAAHTAMPVPGILTLDDFRRTIEEDQRRLMRMWMMPPELVIGRTARLGR